MKMIIKPIPNKEGYFISNDGSVYSQWVNKGKHGLFKGEDLVKLKGSVLNSGHISVKFGRDSKQFFVHRLVYEVFKGEIPENLVVRHLNDIPGDNRLINLAIGTQKENVADAKKNGIFPRGSKNGQSKLTEKEITEIKYLRDKYNKTEIAKMYGVERRTVSCILNNKTWLHVN